MPYLHVNASANFFRNISRNNIWYSYEKKGTSKSSRLHVLNMIHFSQYGTVHVSTAAMCMCMAGELLCLYFCLLRSFFRLSPYIPCTFVSRYDQNYSDTYVYGDYTIVIKWGRGSEKGPNMI